MNIRFKKDNEVVEDQDKVVEKLRRCLMCGRMFDSHGPGNRICKKCKSTSAWRSGLP
jgi:tRNA(Ile2) C34 agmatinyltransferase TiaS